MRPAQALWLLGLSFACSGCALIEDTTRNACVVLSTPLEVHRENARNRRWAEDAWQAACSEQGAHAQSEDYALGFKDGAAMVHNSGEICIRKSNSSKRRGAKDFSRRRLAIFAEEEARLWIQISMSPAIQNDSGDVALGIAPRAREHVSKLLANLAFVFREGRRE